MTGSRRGLAVLHGGVLAAMDMAGVILGFAIYKVVRPANQLAIQVPIAILVTVILFLWWILALDRSPWSTRAPRGSHEFGWTYAFAFGWAAVVFVPAHYLLTGYLTAFSNVATLWVYQGVANLLAIAVVAGVTPGYRAARAERRAESERPTAASDGIGRPTGVGG